MLTPLLGVVVGMVLVGHAPPRPARVRAHAPMANLELDARKNPDLYAPTASESSEENSFTPLSRPPTLLAPAGGWPQLTAAVNSGADACYFGVRDNFNARARAANFAIDELDDVMSYLRRHNVKGYATVNVLIYDSELAAAERLFRALASAGVDAVIVQDLGAIKLCRQLAPGLPVHASTQMSITSPEGAEYAREHGCERVVVGRELSTSEISRVAHSTDAEVEAFVHGAMCVSYSGQCFSSEAWGGRSANRGQCAQACRLPYGLLVNGSLAELGDVSYLLSPQDLSGLAHVPKLIRAGVHCFKVEGRLKGPEYVAMTTAAYREAIDYAWRIIGEGGTDDEAVLPPARMLGLTSNLAQIFARGQDESHNGLSAGFMDGARHQRLVRGRSPGHRGVLVGTVLKVDRKSGTVTISQKPSDDTSGGGERPALRRGVKLKLGDGVVFDSRASRDGRIGEVPEEGGSIYELREGGGEIDSSSETEISFGRSAASPDLARVSVGDLVWRNRDAALERSLRSAGKRPIGAAAADATRDAAAASAGGDADGAAAARSAAPASAVRVSVSGQLGAPLRVRVVDAEGRYGEAESDMELQPARSSPLTADGVRSAVGALGGDGLVLNEYDDSELHLDGLFLPARVLKETRRNAVQSLLMERSSHEIARGLAAETVLPAVLRETLERAAKEAEAEAEAQEGEAAAVIASDQAEITVLCRSPAQVEAALAAGGLSEIGLDFLEVQGLQKAVDAVKQAGLRCVVATPRILKPDEEKLWKFYLRLGADALLVRSSGLLHKLRSFGGQGAIVPGSVGKALTVPELHADFSLNAVNSISAGGLLASGVCRLTPGHDLSGKQLAQLASSLGPNLAARLEVVAHMHLPVFHTEHCVFCRFLSSGDNYTNCGHPCESNAVHLRDSSGHDHLVLADMGCRNTVFNSQAQSAVHLMPRLLAAGVRRFRIELVDEPAEAVAPLIDAYRSVAAETPGSKEGKKRAAAVWKWLQTVPDANGNAQGVTLGSLRDAAEKDYTELKLTKTRAREQQVHLQQQREKQPRAVPRPRPTAGAQKAAARARAQARGHRQKAQF